MRRRVGVALLMPAPARTEIDVLRRALGDGQLDRLPTHLTLVPPINVRDEAMPAVLGLLRSAAANTHPFPLELGPVTTFLPDTPVLYLAVTGAVDAVHALRDRVFLAPLHREITWPFVPHVTLLDDAEPERIAASVRSLADYRVTVTIEAVTLLEEIDRVWCPIADAAFGGSATIGRGSLQLLITRGTEPDPEVAAFLERQWLGHDAAAFAGSTRWERNPFTLAARREGRVIGAATGWTALGVGYLSELIVDPACRGEGVGAHLLTAVEHLARERQCPRLALRTDRGSHAERFYESRGWAVDATIRDWLGGRDFVEMRRDLRL